MDELTQMKEKAMKERVDFEQGRYNVKNSANFCSRGLERLDGDAVDDIVVKITGLQERLWRCGSEDTKGIRDLSTSVSNKFCKRARAKAKQDAIEARKIYAEMKRDTQRVSKHAKKAEKTPRLKKGGPKLASGKPMKSLRTLTSGMNVTTASSETKKRNSRRLGIK